MRPASSRRALPAAASLRPLRNAAGVSEERIRADVDELCDFAGRLAGTDAERRACNHVAEKLRASGRSATVEPTYVQPQWAFVHLLTCALAVVGSTIAQEQPLAGFLCVLVAATTAYLDLSARHYLIRRLPFRRASQNVHTLPGESSGDGPALRERRRTPHRARLRADRARLGRLGRRFPVVSSGTRIWFWSIALLLPPLGVRLMRPRPRLAGRAAAPPDLVLIVACFLLGEIALSPPPQPPTRTPRGSPRCSTRCGGSTPTRAFRVEGGDHGSPARRPSRACEPSSARIAKRWRKGRDLVHLLRGPSAAASRGSSFPRDPPYRCRWIAISPGSSTRWRNRRRTRNSAGRADARQAHQRLRRPRLRVPGASAHLPRSRASAAGASPRPATPLTRSTWRPWRRSRTGRRRRAAARPRRRPLLTGRLRPA